MILENVTEKISTYSYSLKKHISKPITIYFWKIFKKVKKMFYTLTNKTAFNNLSQKLYSSGRKVCFKQSKMRFSVLIKKIVYFFFVLDFEIRK